VAPAGRRHVGRLRLPALIVLLGVALLAGWSARTASATSLDEYSVYGFYGVATGPSSVIRNGLVGSGPFGSTYLGSGTRALSGVLGAGFYSDGGGVITGPLICDGDVSVGSASEVRGDLHVGGELNVFSGAAVTGTATAANTGFIAGDATFGGGGTVQIGPGPAVNAPGPIPLGAFTASSSLTVAADLVHLLSAGTYQFIDITLGPDAVLLLDLAAGGVKFQVAGDIYLMSGARVEVINGRPQSVTTELVGFYTGDPGSLWTGSIDSPYGGVFVGDNAGINGNVHAGFVAMGESSEAGFVPEPMTMVGVLMGLAAVGFAVGRRAVGSPTRR
jgi:hypothetical protein